MLLKIDPISTLNLAIVITTKDRPEKIVNLLQSIANQKQAIQRVLIIDGGQSIESLVNQFAKTLPIEYYVCAPPGQIRQRIMALSLLDSSTSLVALFDDDVVLEPNALSAIFAFWSKCPAETAGVAFNFTNIPAHQHSLIKKIMGISSPKLGEVLTSGYNIPITSISENIESQWLPGGATVWRQDILLSYKQLEVSTKWAPCEDLIFSYPIGKCYKLFVCACARVRHEHPYEHTSSKKNRSYGYTETIWRFLFVQKNDDLRTSYFLWMLFCIVIARFAKGIFFLQPKHLYFALGQLFALKLIIKVILRNQEIAEFLEEKY